MNAISLEHTERIWLNTYLPGVPADIDAGIEDYPSLPHMPSSAGVVDVLTAARPPTGIPA